jgi:hypothetical protein
MPDITKSTDIIDIPEAYLQGYTAFDCLLHWPSHPRRNDVLHGLFAVAIQPDKGLCFRRYCSALQLDIVDSRCDWHFDVRFLCILLRFP